VQRHRLFLVAVLVLSGALLAGPAPAAAFGTIDSGGQHREHERFVPCRTRLRGRHPFRGGVLRGEVD
jgi:hypothetical protein